MGTESPQLLKALFKQKLFHDTRKYIEHTHTQKKKKAFMHTCQIVTTNGKNIRVCDTRYIWKIICGVKFL